MNKLFNNCQFNEKDYYIKGKVVKGIELTEGQQYMLAQENNARVMAYTTDAKLGVHNPVIVEEVEHE